MHGKGAGFHTVAMANPETQPLWRPTDDQIRRSNMTAFMGLTAERWGVEIPDTDTLHAFSINEREKFWQSVIDFADIEAETWGKRILIDGDKMPEAKWFPDARLNFAENMLRHRGGQDALVFWGEDKVKRRFTFDEVHARVSVLAQALTAAGLNFGLLIGLVAGLISFVPYIGSLVGLVLSVGVAFVQFWPDWIMVAIVAGIFFAGQFIEGNILQPKLVGDSVGLHPVWLLFALSAFGALFGFALPIGDATPIQKRKAKRELGTLLDSRRAEELGTVHGESESRSPLFSDEFRSKEESFLLEFHTHDVRVLPDCGQSCLQSAIVENGSGFKEFVGCFVQRRARQEKEVSACGFDIGGSLGEGDLRLGGRQFHSQRFVLGDLAHLVTTSRGSRDLLENPASQNGKLC